MSLLLGIDLGTSSVKAVVFDPDQKAVVGVGSEEYPILRPQPHFAEQDPEQWWAATVNAVRRAIEQAGRGDVSAIGFSGQMHGGVLVDERGSPVYPAVIWADQRGTFADLTQMVEMTSGGADEYHQIAGTMPCLGFMGITLYWLKRHRPDVLHAAHAFIMPKDYVRFKLTGELGTDVSDAAATGILNIHSKVWMVDTLRRWGIPADVVPPIAASSAIAGFVSRQAAEALDVPAGIPVAYGASDQPCQAITNGLIMPGRMSITVGSGGQLFSAVKVGLGETVQTDSRLMVFNHAVPDTYYAEGAILSAGLSLRWLRGVVGLEGSPQAYPILSAEAASTPTGAHGLLFISRLIDERNPWAGQTYGGKDFPHGGFAGLKLHHGRGHMARAVMEGVAYAMKEQFDIIQTMTGKPELVIASGGAMDAPLWRGIMADVLNVPLTQSIMHEQAGTGAAMIAGVGIGRWKSFEEACADVARFGDEVTEPDVERAGYYAERYKVYQELTRVL